MVLLSSSTRGFSRRLVCCWLSLRAAGPYSAPRTAGAVANGLPRWLHCLSLLATDVPLRTFCCMDERMATAPGYYRPAPAAWPAHCRTDGYCAGPTPAARPALYRTDGYSARPAFQLLSHRPHPPHLLTHPPHPFTHLPFLPLARPPNARTWYPSNPSETIDQTPPS